MPDFQEKLATTATEDCIGCGRTIKLVVWDVRYLAWPWYWESMKLEGVCTISMRGLLLQILWQVDDHDSIERAFLYSK